MYSHLCHYKHVALCYRYTLPKSVMFLISLLLNSSRFGSLMLLRSYFPPFLHFPRGEVCFCRRVYKFISGDWSQAVSSWHKSALGLPSLGFIIIIIIIFLLASVQGISVAFVVKVCSLSFHSISFSRKSLLKRVHFKVWTLMYLVYVF